MTSRTLDHAPDHTVISEIVGAVLHKIYAIAGQRAARGPLGPTRLVGTAPPPRHPRHPTRGHATKGHPTREARGEGAPGEGAPAHANTAARTDSARRPTPPRGYFSLIASQSDLNSDVQICLTS